MSKFLSRQLESVSPYTPGEQPQDKGYIKLNTNESPYPPSPAVLQAIQSGEVENLRLYSDPEARRLKSAIAQVYQVAPEWVFVGNGSDEILNFAFQAYGKDDGVAFPDITYGFYQVFADFHGIQAQVIPLQENFSIDFQEYEGLGKMVCLANPNAPTGIALTPSQIERIVQTNLDHVVLIDEAYVDFGAESVVPLTQCYDNLLVVQTYSKSRSMAGARLGFAIGNPQLISDLMRIQFSTNPYNVNRLTLLAGVAAVLSGDYYQKMCQEIVKTRTWTAQSLKNLGFSVTDSQANFVFARHDKLPGDKLYMELKKRGILVRHFPAPRISNYNRITIGTQKEMETLVAALQEMIL